MRKPRKKKVKSKKPIVNQIPGKVVYVGEKQTQGTLIEVFEYSKDFLTYKKLAQVEEAFAYKDSKNIAWIDFDGLNNTQAIESLGNHFGLHPLLLEDIVNTRQRPKIDVYEDYIFLQVKMLYYDTQDVLIKEHVSIAFGENYVISFQEAESDVFDGVRERLQNAQGRLRTFKTDYLAYALLDAILDHYFEVVEQLAEKVENLEDNLFTNNVNNQTALDIQELKREIIRVRKAIFPVKEVIARLENGSHKLIEARTKNYLRDLHDHGIQVAENIEIYREMTWGLMDMYMSSISNKMNEVMKVLTIMASIFIPLTFIAGIYGMNFHHMPELDWEYGYYYAWGVMILISLALVIYFKRKNWW
ncbi:magnesium/cobalt transporter CorA [Mesonia sp. HuA40]|uniref:magnesium/cobalt transporter CorA n=1 Tax=Mesonia sp. HuA40 TaxID=2602761 RepID=UPI0011CAB05B|nr:magnesium/cobalt transporter CorA [Mesonia sp. HuA40]TXK74777.1 magnesium/cobalt transporter CorA [Mesonia sp. HuA40]